MPAVILFTVFFLAPIFISVYYSFTDFSGIGAAKFIGFKNYQVLLKDKFFFIALKNTFIILIGITITILPLSFIVALLLEKPFRGSGVVQSMIFAPNVIAPILVGLIWLFILDPKMGMINAILRSIGLSDYQQQWIGGKTLTPYSVAFVYLWLVVLSFKSDTDILNNPFSLPEHIDLANYERALDTLPLFKMFGNTLIVAVFALLISLVCTFMISYAITRLHLIMQKYQMACIYCLCQDLRYRHILLFFLPIGLLWQWGCWESGFSLFCHWQQQRWHGRLFNGRF